MAETRCLVLTALGRKGLSWLMVSEVADHGQLVPRQGHRGGTGWQRDTKVCTWPVQLMASRKRRQRKSREEGTGAICGPKDTATKHTSSFL